MHFTGVLGMAEITILRRKKPGRTEVLFKAIPCTTTWQRCRGLMFSKPHNLLFVFSHEAIHSFHMFFVFFPIDIVFLDTSNRIVEIQENFRPFTVYTPRTAFKYALEIDAGRVKKLGLKSGNELRFGYFDYGLKN